MRAEVGNGAPNTESTWWDWKPAVSGWECCERLFHSQWYRNKHLIPLQVSHVEMFGYGLYYLYIIILGSYSYEGWTYIYCKYILRIPSVKMVLTI
jgi:hypothetical protein